MRAIASGVTLPGVVLSSLPVMNAPDNDPLTRANELWKQRRFDEAEAAYRDVLQKKPGAAWAIYRLAEIYEFRGDHTLSATYFEQATALDPALRKMRDKATFWKRFKTATDLFDARNLAGAEPIFLELFAINPDSAPLLTKLGAIAVEYGHMEKALAHYERAIATDPGYAWGPIGKAEVLDLLGETGEAIRLLKSVQAGPEALRLSRIGFKDCAESSVFLTEKVRVSGTGPRIPAWHPGAGMSRSAWPL